MKGRSEEKKESSKKEKLKKVGEIVDSRAVSQTDILTCWFLCHRVPEMGPRVEKGKVSQETFVPVPGPFSLIKSFPLFVPVS